MADRIVYWSYHNEDCADMDEEFSDNEMCECGYSVLESALQKYKKFVVEGK
jgi:hypothetical protein